jgi:hypothetical protein
MNSPNAASGPRRDPTCRNNILCYSTDYRLPQRGLALFSGSAGRRDIGAGLYLQPINGTAALWQIDPRTNRVIGKPIYLRLTQPISIAVSNRQLWIADYQSGKLTHFQLIKH